MISMQSNYVTNDSTDVTIKLIQQYLGCNVDESKEAALPVEASLLFQQSSYNASKIAAIVFGFIAVPGICFLSVPMGTVVAAGVVGFVIYNKLFNDDNSEIIKKMIDFNGKISREKLDFKTNGKTKYDKITPLLKPLLQAQHTILTLAPHRPFDPSLGTWILSLDHHVNKVDSKKNDDTKNNTKEESNKKDVKFEQVLLDCANAYRTHLTKFK